MNGSVAGGGVSEEVITLTRGPSGEAGAAAPRRGAAGQRGRAEAGGGQRAGPSAAPSVVRERGDAVPAPGVPPRGRREPRALREQRPVEPRPGGAALEPCWRPCAECVAPEGDRELCKQERTPSDLVCRDNRAAKCRRLLCWKQVGFQHVCGSRCLRGSSCCPVKRQVCCPSALLDAQNWGHSYSLWAVVPHKGSSQRPEGTSEFVWDGAELTVRERE